MALTAPSRAVLEFAGHDVQPEVLVAPPTTGWNVPAGHSAHGSPADRQRGFRGWKLGFEAWGLIAGVEFGVWGVGFGVWDLWCGV